MTSIVDTMYLSAMESWPIAHLGISFQPTFDSKFSPLWVVFVWVFVILTPVMWHAEVEFLPVPCGCLILVYMYMVDSTSLVRYSLALTVTRWVVHVHLLTHSCSWYLYVCVCPVCLCCYCRMGSWSLGSGPRLHRHHWMAAAVLRSRLGRHEEAYLLMLLLFRLLSVISSSAHNTLLSIPILAFPRLIFYSDSFVPVLFCLFLLLSEGSVLWRLPAKKAQTHKRSCHFVASWSSQRCFRVLFLWRNDWLILLSWYWM